MSELPRLNRNHNRIRRIRRLVSRSSSGQRSPVVVPTRRARSQWRPLSERNDVVDVDAHAEFVDLTSDQDEDLVIDLTSPTHTNAPTRIINSPVMVLNSRDPSSPLRERGYVHDIENDIDHLDLSSDLTDKSPSSSLADKVTCSSPGIRRIACPVCMDDYKELQQEKVQLMSTICGHLFCKPCIKASIRSNHRCPTCRKRLTEKGIHPIFV